MKLLFIAILLFPYIAFADSYAVYNKDTGEIINVIVYDGVAEYDETVFHGVKAKKEELKQEDKDKGITIGDEYKDGKFEKKCQL